MRDLESAVDAVLGAVSEPYVVDLACRLVRTPSVYHPEDPGANEAAAAALARAELAWLERLISRRVPLEHWAEALEHRDGDVKVVVEVA